MDEPMPELQISLSVPDGDPAEVDKLTRLLRSEIEQLDVETVEAVSAGPVPAGAKAMDWQVVGQMVVTLAPVVITPLFELVKSWIQRQPAVPVKVKIRMRVGKRISEVEYDPAKTSEEDLRKLLKTLQAGPKR